MSSNHHLSIHLNGPTGQLLPPNVSPLFIPSQDVSGILNLILPKATTVSRVILRFQGRFSTSIIGTVRNSIPDNHTHTLFSFETVIFAGDNRKLSATTYSWPFSFVFPETFEFLDDIFEDNERSRRFWVAMGEHPLPPSMDSGTDLTFASHGNDSRTRAEVAYELQVVVPRKLMPDWVLKVPLNFTPIRSEAAPAPRMQKHVKTREQRFRYDTQGQPRALTASESLKEKFKSSPETKALPFEVACRAPTVVVLGKPYSIFIKLDCAQLPGENVVTPVFTLERVRAHLVAFNNIRTIGPWYNVVVGSRAEGFATDLPLLDTKMPLNVTMPPGEVTRIENVFTTVGPIPPSFSSISINRKYALVINLTIKGLEETHEISFRWDKVLLLPARMAEGVEEALTLVRTEQFRNEDMDNGLPNFEEATAGTHEAPPPAAYADISPPPYQETPEARYFGSSR